MTLAGLLSAALGDPGLTRARDLARSGAAQADGLDITAPPALRPFVVAAVAAGFSLLVPEVLQRSFGELL